MCFGRRSPSPPPPAPLPPSPPPPPPPPVPVKRPEPIGTEMDPQVRRKKSKKDKNPYKRGTQTLRISLDPQVNTPTESGGTPNQ